MKTLKYVLLCVFLIGCSTTADFDSSQYDRLADIVSFTNITNRECSDPAASKINVANLQNKIAVFEVSTRYRGDEVYHNSAIVIGGIVKTLNTAYSGQKEPSPAYCYLKTEAIKLAAEHTLLIMGKK